jgi:hypothetical protein
MNTNTSNSRFSQGLGSVRDPKLRYVLLPVFFMFMGFLLTRFVGFGDVGKSCDDSDPPECKMTNLGLASVLVGLFTILFSMWFAWKNRHRWTNV